MSNVAEERFRDLYDRRHPAIIAYFARRIGSQDAADAADDVFAVAWRRLDQVPGGEQELAWLYGVSHNVLANRRRGERRGNRLLARIAGQRQPNLLGPEPQVLRNLDGQHVIAAMATLRPADQELLLLSYWEGLTHSQIGDLLGCSKSAVDARVHRALHKMRQAMKRSGHIPSSQASEIEIVREQP